MASPGHLLPLWLFSSPLPSTASQVPCLLFYIISSFISISCVASILIQTLTPLSQNVILASSSVPSVYTLFASVALLVSGILLLSYPGCGVLFPCTSTSSGQLRNPRVLSRVVVCLRMTSSPQTSCFQISVLLLDLTSRFPVYKYYISLTLTKLSNLYHINSLLTGILLYFQSGPITVAKWVHVLDQLIIFISAG